MIENSLLVCVECQGTLTQDNDILTCTSCSKKYRIKEDIPILLKDDKHASSN